MTIVELWDELGVNKAEVLERFAGSVEVAQKCTVMYAEDTIINDLKKAVESHDYSGVERAAHTLKGVADNLGFKDVHRYSQIIVDDVRSGNYDNLSSEFEKLKAEHDKICVLAKAL